MRHAHVCPYCDHRSTRWWNLKVHIKRRHGGFLLGRSSDSNSLSPNNPYHNIGSATVADSIGNTFEPTYLHQQTPVGTSQYSTSPIHRPLPTIDVLSQDKIVKIGELRRLLYKCPQYFTNPDGIIKWAVYCSSNGDDRFLNDKLEQLRSIDSLVNIRF